MEQKRGNVQLGDEEQEDAQPPEHELGQEPDPAHAEPEAANPAEADQEAEAGREQSRLEEQTRFFSSRETRPSPKKAWNHPEIR